MTQLRRVTVRVQLTTRCPNGGEDVNQVSVTWTPDPRIELVHAERVHEAVHAWDREEVYCEHLAMSLAKALRPLIGRPLAVVVTQLQGHGVEAEAVEP